MECCCGEPHPQWSAGVFRDMFLGGGGVLGTTWYTRGGGVQVVMWSAGGGGGGTDTTTDPKLWRLAGSWIFLDGVKMVRGSLGASRHGISKYQHLAMHHVESWG